MFLFPPSIANMGAFAPKAPPLAWQVFWSKQDRMRRLSRQSIGPELKAKAAAKRRRKAEAWAYNLEMTRVARELHRLARGANAQVVRGFHRLARGVNEKALADLIEIVRGGR